MGLHTDALERRYDGAIPAALRAQARQRDDEDFRRAGAPRPAAAPAPKRRWPSSDALVAAMARLMVDRAAIDGACSESDLACAGFTKPERLKHAEAAQRRAAAIVADRGRR